MVFSVESMHTALVMTGVGHQIYEEVHVFIVRLKDHRFIKIKQGVFDGTCRSAGKASVNLFMVECVLL